MTSTKLCKDCKWCERFGLFRDVKSFSRCLHPESANPPVMDIVTGMPEKRKPEYCSVMRIRGQACGSDAAWFAPRRITGVSPVIDNRLLYVAWQSGVPWRWWSVERPAGDQHCWSFIVLGRLEVSFPSWRGKA